MPTTTPRRRGRPRVALDAGQVERMAALGCTVDEIAGVFRCSGRTLQRHFCHPLERGRAMMRIALRRKQFELAEAGDCTMLIWLGKQLLGQSNKVETRSRNATLEDLIREAAG